MINPKKHPTPSPKSHSTLPTVAGLRLTRQRQEVYHVLMEKRFTGKLPKYENISNVLKLLALTTNIKFELNDRTLIVQLE